MGLHLCNNYSHWNNSQTQLRLLTVPKNHFGCNSASSRSENHDLYGNFVLYVSIDSHRLNIVNCLAIFRQEIRVVKLIWGRYYPEFFVYERHPRAWDKWWWCRPGSNRILAYLVGKFRRHENLLSMSHSVHIDFLTRETLLHHQYHFVVDTLKTKWQVMYLGPWAYIMKQKYF